MKSLTVSLIHDPLNRCASFAVQKAIFMATGCHKPQENPRGHLLHLFCNENGFVDNNLKCKCKTRFILENKHALIVVFGAKSAIPSKPLMAI